MSDESSDFMYDFFLKLPEFSMLFSLIGCPLLPVQVESSTNNNDKHDKVDEHGAGQVKTNLFDGAF